LAVVVTVYDPSTGAIQRLDDSLLKFLDDVASCSMESRLMDASQATVLVNVKDRSSDVGLERWRASRITLDSWVKKTECTGIPISILIGPTSYAVNFKHGLQVQNPTI